ncbi:hypothetical protein MARA_07430 [Mycolicibacterium arabiense]|uniref:Uncharacterized protein n=1 Tax=Mycolicibacterium arabiense TaxID=1286181 RepID=A0A7I7RU56_9MYCO|nr:hypothetical protein MARA_07430 [Mycolicibacterium arabiense]
MIIAPAPNATANAPTRPTYVLTLTAESFSPLLRGNDSQRIGARFPRLTPPPASVDYCTLRTDYCTLPLPSPATANPSHGARCQMSSISPPKPARPVTPALMLAR